MDSTHGLNGQRTLPAIRTSEEGVETNAGKITSSALRRLIDKQGKRCALTGVDLTPQTVSLDHIKPLDDGGADDMSNVQLVHSIVNTMKGTMAHAEFVKWCRLVASHCIDEQ